MFKPAHSNSSSATTYLEPGPASLVVRLSSDDIEEIKKKNRAVIITLLKSSKLTLANLEDLPNDVDIYDLLFSILEEILDSTLQTHQD